MKLHEFYQKYSNINLEDRDKQITYNKSDCKSPNEIYSAITLEKWKIDTANQEIEKLLSIADKIIN